MATRLPSLVVPPHGWQEFVTAIRNAEESIKVRHSGSRTQRSPPDSPRRARSPRDPTGHMKAFLTPRRELSTSYSRKRACAAKRIGEMLTDDAIRRVVASDMDVKPPTPPKQKPFRKLARESRFFLTEVPAEGVMIQPMRSFQGSSQQSSPNQGRTMATSLPPKLILTRGSFRETFRERLSSPKTPTSPSTPKKEPAPTRSRRFRVAGLAAVAISKHQDSPTPSDHFGPATPRENPETARAEPLTKLEERIANHPEYMARAIELRHVHRLTDDPESLEGKHVRIVRGQFANILDPNLFINVHRWAHQMDQMQVQHAQVSRKIAALQRGNEEEMAQVHKTQLQRRILDSDENMLRLEIKELKSSCHRISVELGRVRTKSKSTTTTDFVVANTKPEAVLKAKKETQLALQVARSIRNLSKLESALDNASSLQEQRAQALSERFQMADQRRQLLELRLHDENIPKTEHWLKVIAFILRTKHMAQQLIAQKGFIIAPKIPQNPRSRRKQAWLVVNAAAAFADSLGESLRHVRADREATRQQLGHRNTARLGKWKSRMSFSVVAKTKQRHYRHQSVFLVILAWIRLRRGAEPERMAAKLHSAELVRGFLLEVQLLRKPAILRNYERSRRAVVALQSHVRQFALKRTALITEIRSHLEKAGAADPKLGRTQELEAATNENNAKSKRRQAREKRKEGQKSARGGGNLKGQKSKANTELIPGLSAHSKYEAIVAETFTFLKRQYIEDSKKYNKDMYVFKRALRERYNLLDFAHTGWARVSKAAVRRVDRLYPQLKFIPTKPILFSCPPDDLLIAYAKQAKLVVTVPALSPRAIPMIPTTPGAVVGSASPKNHSASPKLVSGPGSASPRNKDATVTVWGDPVEVVTPRRLSRKLSLSLQQTVVERAMLKQASKEDVLPGSPMHLVMPTVNPA